MLSFSEFLRKYRVKYSEKQQKIGKNYFFSEKKCQMPVFGLKNRYF